MKAALLALRLNEWFGCVATLSRRFEFIPDLSGYLIQLFPRRFLEITRREFKPETITVIAGKEMQMDVENFLPGCFTICQK